MSLHASSYLVRHCQANLIIGATVALAVFGLFLLECPTEFWWCLGIQAFRGQRTAS